MGYWHSFLDKDITEASWERIYSTWYKVNHNEIDFETWKKQKDWCVLNINGDFTAHAGGWYFKQEEDAVAYKLVWI